MVLNLKDIEFPMTLNQIKKFEHQNNNNQSILEGLIRAMPQLTERSNRFTLTMSNIQNIVER